MFKCLNIVLTFGPSTGPHQCQGFHLDESSCLVCIGETAVITYNELIVSRTKILTSSNKFWKERHFPYQEGLLLLVRTRDWHLACGLDIR